MEGSKGVGCTFESVGVVVGRVVIGPYPLRLVLEPLGEHPTIQDLFDLPFWLGAIDHRGSLFLALARKGVTGVLSEHFSRIDGMAGLFPWDSDLVRVAYLLDNLVRAVVLVS